MSRRSSFLLLTILVVGVAWGQWSEPVPFFVRSDSIWLEQSVLANWSPETAGVAYIRTVRRPVQHAYSIMVRSWMGDSWSEAVNATGDDTMVPGIYCGLGYGLDPLGRAWLSWYRGNHYTFDEDDSWAICTTFRDSSGWRPFEKTFCPYYAGYTSGFTTDRAGRWCMGLDHMYSDPPGCFTDAMYSVLMGDTWASPRLIAAGMGNPMQISQCCPVLRPHPREGLWAVSDRSGYRQEDKVRVYHVTDDTSRLVLDFAGLYSTADVDTAGRLWILYSSDSTLGYVVAAESSVVESGLLSEIRQCTRPFVCVDLFGWVWAAWNHPDGRFYVAYNAGQGWSEPEAVVDTSATVTGLVSDGSGQMFVSLVKDLSGAWGFGTCFREYRPGVQDEGEDGMLRTVGPGIVRGMLLLPGRQLADLLDIAGRQVTSLQPGENDIRHVAPGVYFTMPARDSRPQKVIVTR
jgi:hypothetical protein